jgi:hypothetical protein
MILSIYIILIICSAPPPEPSLEPIPQVVPKLQPEPEAFEEHGPEPPALPANLGLHFDQPPSASKDILTAILCVLGLFLFPIIFMLFIVSIPIEGECCGLDGIPLISSPNYLLELYHKNLNFESGTDLLIRQQVVFVDLPTCNVYYHWLHGVLVDWSPVSHPSPSVVLF